MVEWKLTNINAVAYFDTPIRLDKLAERIYKDHLTNYNPENFPGLIIYLGKFRISIFRNGSIIITGIKKVEDLIPVVEKIRELLKRYEIHLPEKYRVEIVTSSIYGKFDYNNIDIEKMGTLLDTAIYDPNRFPAVTVYYGISPGYKVSFNIFKNGSFVAVGFKSDPSMLLQHIDQVVKSFQENIVKRFTK